MSWKIVIFNTVFLAPATVVEMTGMMIVYIVQSTAEILSAEFITSGCKRSDG